MGDTVQDSMLCLVAINGDSEFTDGIYSPTLEDLIHRLDEVRSGRGQISCVECEIRLATDVEGSLSFIRVNQPLSGTFGGWIVQLSSAVDYASFALARMFDSNPSQVNASRMIEFLSYVNIFDSRCVLSHSDVLDWVREELSGMSTSDRYGWIDFSIALKELS